MRLVAAVILAQGCGTSILVSYPADVPFLRAHSEIATSNLPLEDPVQTTVARIETRPLRVACETTTTVAKVQTTWADTYGVGRLWCGFMAISEGALAAGIATNDHGSGGTIASAIIGADALGALVYAIVASSSARTYKTVGPGQTAVSQACPDGLVVRSGDATWAVNTDGSLAGDVKALAQAAVAGSAIAIVGDGSEVAWSPEGSDRCALVAEHGLEDPSDSCAKPSEVTAAAAAPRVVVPLQIRIRLRGRVPR